MIDRLWDKLRGFADWVREHKKWVPGYGWLYGGAGGGLIGKAAGLVGMQQGGHVTSGGAFMVGERGPELALLPRGSAVTPLPPTLGAGSIDMPEFIQVFTSVRLDGKEIAEAESRHKAKKRAHQ